MNPRTHTHTMWPWAAAVALFAFIGLMQTADDAAEAQAMATTAADAHAMAKAARRTELAAAELCAKTNGLGATHAWAEDGTLVCKRGNS